MAAERLVKWSKEAKDFFEKAEDNSLVLDLVMSHACASQTGEGFEELVNTINSESIKRKVKKVVITDTSYLYRHTIPEFSIYSDQNIPTIWFLNNRASIKRLGVEVEIKSWVHEINKEEYKEWYKRILTDYMNNKNCDNMQINFRDTVNSESAISQSKGFGSFEGCRNYFLEETAHACAVLNNKIVLCPINLSDSIVYAMKSYGINVTHLKYKLSSSIQKNIRNPSEYDYAQIDQKVSAFMRNDIKGVNFFVVDTKGNYIYRNNAFSKLVGNSNNINIDPKSWEVSKTIMENGMQKTVEEEFQGTTYLSVKAPLVIDYKIEGVIGLAVDITDRKKAEELGKKLAIEKELYEVERMLVDDICSPGLSL
ncbi:MAG: hypothetical protein LBU10_00005, partial [Endomicrobium sp.]|nr:hypothetical protein [Endomicrobium sp.]